MVSTLRKTNFKFSVGFMLSSANAFNLEQSKNLSFGKEIMDIMLEELHDDSPGKIYGDKTPFCHSVAQIFLCLQKGVNSNYCLY